MIQNLAATAPEQNTPPTLWLQGNAVDAILPLRTYSLVLAGVACLVSAFLALLWWSNGQPILGQYHIIFSACGVAIFLAILGGMSAAWYFGLLTAFITTGIWFFSITSYHFSSLAMVFLFFTSLYHFVLRPSVSFCIQLLTLMVAMLTPTLAHWFMSGSLVAVHISWYRDFSLFAVVYATLSAYAYYYARTFAAHRQLVTEQNLRLQASEQRLLYLEKKKNKFIADMNHELRTPLNAILGIADIIRNQKLPPNEIETLLNQMQQAGDQLLMIINDVLDLTRLHENSVTIQAKPSTLAAILDHAVSVMRPLAQVKGLDLQVYYQQDCLDTLLIDDKKLSQVIINLLGNAIKFSHKGRVTLRAHSVPQEDIGAKPALAVQADTKLRHYHISVEDEGIGIEAEHLPHIFEEFHQGASTTHDQFGGSGLGLHISKKFMEIMHGSIDVSSTPGVGSRFTLKLSLPLVSSMESSHLFYNGEPKTSPTSASKERLLQLKPELKIHIIDDNQLNLVVAQKLLSSYYPSFETHVLPDPSTLLEAMKGRPSDIILLDVNIPGHSTLAVVRMIRQTYPTTKVIAFTADSTFVQTNAWRLHGYHGVLLKPFKIEALTSLFIHLFADTEPPEPLACPPAPPSQLATLPAPAASA